MNDRQHGNGNGSDASDRAGLAAELERLQPELRAFIRLRAGKTILDKESCSDIAQSVCREILEHQDRFEHPGPDAVKHWLFRTALRKLGHRYDHYQAARRDVRRERAVDARSREAEEQETLQCYRTFCTPSAQAIAGEELQRIEQAFDRLPDDRREVIVMARLMGPATRRSRRSWGAANRRCAACCAGRFPSWRNCSTPVPQADGLRPAEPIRVFEIACNSTPDLRFLAVPRTHEAVPMPSRNSLLLFVFLLAAALGVGRARAQVVAYHDQTAAQHQNYVNTLGGTGYRMITLSMYDDPLNPKYAAVWVHRTGPNWVAFHGADAATFQSLRSTWGAQSYLPTILSADGSGSSIRFAGVFEYNPAVGYSSYNLTQSQFDQQCANARTNGYRLVTATVYGAAFSPQFAATFRQNTEHIDWGYTISSGAAGYQSAFNAFTAGWTRPAHVALNSYGVYLSIWHDDQLQNGWVAAHDMTSAAYQSMVTTQSGAGRYPICVQAGGLGSSTRFAAIFASSENVTGRSLTTTGTAVPELAAFDTYVQQLMQSDNIRGASLAVIKDGRLMMSRGYTWAEPGYPLTQPTSLFRVASASKALTSIGIHHLMAQPLSLVNDSRTMLSFFPSIVPADPRTNNITLQHLLTHRGGWDINVLHFDPAFYDGTINAFYGGTLPITKDDIYQYMTTQQNLQFVPGAFPGAYSNYGFMMLGKVLERSNPGLTYEQIIKRDVFTPLGVTRARIGGSLLAQAAPGEVRYHPVGPYIAGSVLSQAQPLVPGQYGGWNQGNLDAEGGWVLAAPDYAKVLASFSLGDNNPLLNTSWTNHMWSTVPGGPSNLLRGWWETDVYSQGQLKRLRHHNGELPGTATFCCLRSDGVGFCLFLNRDHWIGDVPNGTDMSAIADQVVTWPNHDLFPAVGLPALYSHVGGTFTSFGSGCAGSTGVPSHSGLGTSEVGYSFSLRVTNVPSPSFAIALVGSSRTSWQGTPLPLSVPGAPGCSLRVAPEQMIATIVNGGVGSLGVNVPNSQSLIGVHLYSQWAVLDAAANPLGLAFSNGIDTLIGGWQ